MHSTIWRRSGAAAGAAVLAAALPIIASSSPAQAATTIDKTIDYTCQFQVNLNPADPTGPLASLGDFPVPTKITATVPDLEAGQTVAATPVGVQLRLPDDIHSLTVGSLNGDLVSGRSTNAQVGVRADGTTKDYTVGGLSVEYFPIEQDVTKPWLIDINGSTPEIPVPSSASSLDLLAPANFFVSAEIYNDAKEFQFNATLDCTAPADARVLATAPVAGVVDPTPDPTDDPTTAPTDDPTAGPTDDPTTDPTDDPTDGSGVGNGGGTINPVNDRDTVAASNDALPNTGAPNQLAMIGLLGAALLLGGGGLVARRTVIARHRA